MATTAGTALEKASARRVGVVARSLLLAAGVSCGSSDSATSLNPEGPPLVRQVFVNEVLVEGTAIRTRAQLAYGGHPDLDDNDDGVVLTAVAGDNQQIRIVFDEILPGYAIEEIACANGINYSRVPPDATPDDVAACSGPVESLEDCVDICVVNGQPVGILDVEPLGAPDGAADDFRMIDYGGVLAATVTCDGVNIPLDRERSFWNPSGNQLIPAGPLGYRGLGPVLVLAPANGMRTNSTCTIDFRPELVDEDGNRVCAPADGDPALGCDPGDTSAISFGVQPLQLSVTVPTDGNMGVSVDQTQMFLQFNTNIDKTTTGGITLQAQGGAFVGLVDDPDDNMRIVKFNVATPLVPGTTYLLTVPVTVLDTFGGAFPQEQVITFSVAPLGVAATTPSAGAVNVPVGQQLTIRFNADVDKTTTGTITLAVEGGGAVTLVDVPDPDPRTVRFDPQVDLLANTTYVLTVPTSVLDTFGGALPAPITTSFTTTATP